MHCYETRFGGKCASEVTSPLPNQRSAPCEELRNNHQQVQCCDQLVGDKGHHLRSRTHFWPHGSLVAKTAEEQVPDSSSQPQPARTTRDADDSLCDDDLSETPIRKRKRLTAEEKLIEDNRAYYKLEMKNNKLRSSGYFPSHRNSFEMGHAFVREADEPLVSVSKSSTVVSNCSTAPKSGSDQKLIGRRAGSDAVSKDIVEGGYEVSKLRKVRKNGSDKDDSEDLSDSEDSYCKEGDGENERLRSSSSEQKSSGYRKGTVESKCGSRKVTDPGKELKVDSSAMNDCTDKKTSNNDVVSHKDTEDLKNCQKPEIKTEGSNSGTVHKRIRLSELSLLSNEAENFMFGEPVKKISSDESSDVESVKLKIKIVKKTHGIHKKEKWKAKKTVIKKKRGRPLKKIHKKAKVLPGNTSALENGKQEVRVHQFDDSSIESVDTCSLGSSSDLNTISRRRRKRRTHAEAFIHDNLDYYKFEIPGSRLRFQGSVLPHTSVSENQVTESESSYSKKLNENSHASDSNKENSLNSSDSPLISFNARSLEAIRKGLNEKLSVDADSLLNSGSEILIEPGIKKEESSDKPNDTVGNDTAVDRLQFSFEAVPKNEPWYQTYQRQDDANEIYLSNDSFHWKPFLLPYEMTPLEIASAAAKSGLPTCSKPISESSVIVKKRRRRFAHLGDKKPRKSPRCHASTLAILSGFVHFRRRKGLDKCKDSLDLKEDITVSADDDQNDDASNLSLPKDSSSKEGTPCINTDLGEIARNIDSMMACFPENRQISPQEMSNFPSGGIDSKLRTPKSGRVFSKKLSRTHRERISKTLQEKCLKEDDLIDIDPCILANLAISSSVNGGCFPKPEIRDRGGPLIDLLSLIDGSSECQCTNVPFNVKDCLRCGTDLLSPALREGSCNSSECGASSTCETVAYSDTAESRHGVRGRRRKRKKNRTGWPIDKQKFRRKFHMRLKKGNENIPVSSSNIGCATECARSVCVTSEAGISLASAIKEECSKDFLGVASDAKKCVDGVSDISESASSLLDRVDETAACKTCGTVDKSVLKDDTSSVSTNSNDPTPNDKKLDKDSASRNVPVTGHGRFDKHTRLLRTGSLDSSTQRSDMQPCVRVKKISNLSDYQIVSPVKIGISNRRLRSASSSSISTPVMKRDFTDDCAKEDTTNSRRSSGRKKRPKYGDSWDSWLTPSRR